MFDLKWAEYVSVWTADPHPAVLFSIHPHDDNYKFIATFYIDSRASATFKCHTLKQAKDWAQETWAHKIREVYEKHFEKGK
jgi:hypothetical protein